ncbi:hypothetical protein [Marinobacter sp.]|jgi:hypothetical protein|uniref:Nmad3 family putative nucleotide modification protein n=1 Tax=Marinobacter sp. TaxID=50741 RepID=UPI0025C4715B|nr:hypothetical protein [Marinobacter sp.]|tara:strand:+ start:26 stop:868 length:843 start_codon:yes stop_codon:yes gene_type:complete
MKLILSRKGFDSSAGGCPSPVFPDGSFYTLPIPDSRSRITYGDIRHEGLNVGKLVADLTGDRRGGARKAHLDPDLIADAYPRETGWRPCLGQTGAAQGHLRKQQVGEGDLFLFFGLFRDVEKQGRCWQFVKQARPFHGLWGWLQIGEVYRIDELSDSDLQWARYHPHFHGQPDGGNTLYVASDALQLGGRSTGLPGAGVFGGLEDRLRLTAPDAASTTQWRLPRCFYPDSADTAMSFHGNLARWSRDGDDCTLRSASRGQEFVLDTIEYPGVVSWLREIL